MDLTLWTAVVAVLSVGVAVTWLFAAWGLLAWALVLLAAAVLLPLDELVVGR